MPRAALLAALFCASACKTAPKKLDWVAAPAAGDVSTIVEHELGRAKREGRKLLVYVGATWCEPCQRFHRAAGAGALDAAFPELRVLEFDLDRDRERLSGAGYQSRLIPLFAVPLPSGFASGRQIEGSIKGDGAVGEITPRLRALLAP
jgi:hypothetical protein